jgi:hypothetical protein
MQKQRFPVDRDTIFIKANEIYSNLHGSYITRAKGHLSHSWINKLMNRHPFLSLRSAQVIKKNRNEADEGGLIVLLNELIKHSVVKNLCSDRIFYMDETAFAQKAKSKKVIALCGSRNVWKRQIESSFHLTIVSCAAANGLIVPPLFILPGARLNCDVMDACHVTNARVTVSVKGFMNSKIFVLWLEHFSNLIPDHVKCPILLIYDGYSSHYNEEIVGKALSYKIIIVPIPANATHLIQPLDVAVFKSFKIEIKRHIEAFMIENAVTTIKRRDAVGLASEAWNKGVVAKKQNVISGFQTCGLWPISYPAMLRRLRLFRDGGIKNRLRYLKGTKDFGLRLGLNTSDIDCNIIIKEMSLRDISDADFANFIDDRRSIGGILFNYGIVQLHGHQKFNQQ